MKKRLLTEDDHGELMEEISSMADGDHSHLWNEIGDKPDFHSISLSGSYLDLNDKPSLFSGSYLDLSNKPSLFSGSYTDLTNKPSLHSVSLSGSYLDLEDIPDEVDLSNIETRLDDLEIWAARKTTSIPPVTNTPNNSTVTLLGIQIPSSGSFSGLINDYIALRDSHNSLLASAKSWGWMNT